MLTSPRRRQPDWRHVAVDLGAASGRVIEGTVHDGRLTIRPLHRFLNRVIEREGILRWDLDRLYAGMLEGLARAAEGTPESGRLSLGIDSWAIDYCLLDESGTELRSPRHYRDGHIADGIRPVHRRISPAELYRETGTQFLPFNTIYQLAVDQADGHLVDATTMLMIPDLLLHRLTQTVGGEITNASTTGFFDVRNRRWHHGLIDRLGIDPGLLPPVHEPGTIVGETIETHGGRRLLAVRVASHDTASAVVGTPAAGDDWAFISSGTWSLVGVELDRPVITDASRSANFTNELGPDGTVRYLRNVTGMWLLQESMRTWKLAGRTWRLPQLLGDAAKRPPGPVFDPDHPDLLAPGDMPSRIRAICGLTRQLDDDAAIARCIMESLATKYAEVLDGIEATTGRTVRTVHIAGGGARNALLCQLTADASGRTVIAGPVEATAIGNLLMQAKACGVVPGALGDLRLLGARSVRTRRYDPLVTRGATT